MKTTDLVRPIIEERGGILLEAGEGETLVLDRFARGVLPLPMFIESGAQVEGALSLIDELYTRAVDEHRPKPVLAISAFLEDINDDESFAVELRRLVTSLATAGDCQFIIYFSRRIVYWIPFLKWLFRLLNDCSTPISRVEIRGPFDKLDETTKEAFFGLGVHLGFVIRWWQDSAVTGRSPVMAEALSDLARYGFRIPVINYIHADNIGAARSLIEEGLALNRHSGFSLPLILHHPAFAFESGQPELPDPAEYWRLLNEVYDQITYHDDLFFPINEIAGFVGGGAWDPENDVPSRINLLATPKKGVGTFRQIPAFARDWRQLNELNRLTSDSVGPNLVERHRAEFRWDSNAFCRRCSWRFACAGVDGWDARDDSSANALKVVCDYRKRLLEVFAHERAKLLLSERAGDNIDF